VLTLQKRQGFDELEGLGLFINKHPLKEYEAICIIREAITDFSQKVNMYTFREGDKALSFLKTLSNYSFNTFLKPDIILLELKI
jgi:hypothetical protein